MHRRGQLCIFSSQKLLFDGLCLSNTVHFVPESGCLLFFLPRFLSRMLLLPWRVDVRQFRSFRNEADRPVNGRDQASPLQCGLDSNGHRFLL